MNCYKVFRVEQQGGSTSFKCGHSRCPHPDHRVDKPGKRVLLGRSTRNTDLQKVGDKASASLPLEVCSNGWHGFTAGQASSWLDEHRWHSGQQALFRVALTGQIKRASDKIVGQHIEMLEEIPFSSPAGVKFRAEQAAARTRQKVRERAAEQRRQVRIKARMKAAAAYRKLMAQRKKETLRKREILLVTRQIKLAQAKLRRLR
jgi:hypothetical protein